MLANTLIYSAVNTAIIADIKPIPNDTANKKKDLVWIISLVNPILKRLTIVITPNKTIAARDILLTSQLTKCRSTRINRPKLEKK